MSSFFHNMPTGAVVTPFLRLEYLQEPGPRIVHLSLSRPGARSQNLMADVPDLGTATPYGTFHPYGGHRLTHAPEGVPRSYIPDNDGCGVEQIENGVVLRGRIEATTGVQKSIQVTASAERPSVSLVHTLTNCGIWPIELAAWALTQLRLGGVAIFPQTAGEVDAAGVLPNRNLVLWPYTRLADPRLNLSDDLYLVHATADAQPIKIGYLNRTGWAAYLIDDVLFVKRWNPQPHAAYVDQGCNCESYCNDRFIEVETLGPLSRLEPGKSVTHAEEWELYRVDDREGTFERAREVVKRVGLL